MPPGWGAALPAARRRRAAYAPPAARRPLLALLVLCAAVAAAGVAFDPYKTLGINRDATEAEIKKAYRRASMQAHPDKGGSKEAFIAVSEAYQVLSDPGKRREYDRTGSAPKGHRTQSFDEAEAMLKKFLDELEEIISDEGKLDSSIDSVLSQVGNADTADQSWMEWGMKSAAKKGLKWLAPAFLQGVKDGNIDIKFNGQEMRKGQKRPGSKRKTGGKSKLQQNNRKRVNNRAEDL